MVQVCLSRREFLKASGLAAAGFLLPSQGAASQQKLPAVPVGIAAQMYSVRGDCKANMDAALEAVAKIGFSGVEFAGYYQYSRDAAGLKKRLEDLGLKAAGTHIGTGSFRGDNLKRTIDFHGAIGCKYLIVPGDGDFTKPDKWKALADFFNETAARLKPYGMYCGYHCHTGEFRTLEQKTYWELFAENTCMDVVLQQDCGWSFAAGQNPAELIRKYPGRSRTLHLKPSALPRSGAVALLGQDSVPWKSVLDAARKDGGTEWLTIEQETYPLGKSPMECLALSYQVLQTVMKEIE